MGVCKKLLLILCLCASIPILMWYFIAKETPEQRENLRRLRKATIRDTERLEAIIQQQKEKSGAK